MFSNVLHLLSQRTSRTVLSYYALGKILKPVDAIGACILRGTYTGNYPERDRPPVFIIGLPRSGSTLLYQYLSLVLNVTYSSNIWSIFPQCSPYITRIVKSNAPEEFTSFFGNGAKLHSVQEGGRIFDQWFPDRRQHYYAEVDSKTNREMIDYFSLVSRRSLRPWLIKNGRNAVRLAVFSKAFRNARYIRLRRDHVLVAQSILRGRRALKGGMDRTCTVLPKEWPDIAHLPYPEQVARQVYYIDRQIDRDMDTIPSKDVIEIEYSQFCANPRATAEDIQRRFTGLEFRQNVPEAIWNRTFEVSEKRSIDPVAYCRIEAELRAVYEEA